MKGIRKMKRLKKVTELMLVVGGLMLPMTAKADIQSSFYSSSSAMQISPFGSSSFGNIGASSMSTGSGYSSAAATGTYSVGSSSMRVGARKAVLSTLDMFGASTSDDLLDDPFDFGDDNPETPPVRPGDPLVDPIGDGWDVYALLLLLTGVVAFCRRRAAQLTTDDAQCKINN